MIEVKNLKKSFGKNIVLDGIDLKLEKGKVYGLLGRNGIGKSTLLSIIGCQIKRDSGVLMLDREELYENQKSMQEICLIRDTGFGVEREKNKNIFEAASYMYKDWNYTKFKKLLVEFNFEKNLNKTYSSLSRGNKTILGIIIGLASESEYLLLDEPTLGLDAVYKDKFQQEIFKEIENRDRCIVISTHSIDESVNLFEDIIILDQGEVLIQENIEHLLSRAYSIRGDKDVVYEFIRDKNIISEEKFSNTSIVNILDDLSKDEKDKMLDENIKIENISLQKLFVYITDDYRL